jgi:peptidoglycan/xylan/chitin deacetylase (PgdA/CDA1 family)
MLNWYKRRIASVLFKQMLTIDVGAPLISFTFDDFPQSALHRGGNILKRYGATGTYFTSLGLMGLDSPSGRICNPDDLVMALDEGHELGCHTFAHCDSWSTDGLVFEQSIIENRAALAKIVPGASFRSFSYPLSTPRPSVKRASAKHFACSRAGGQTFNSGKADLNQLSAYFLEKAKGDITPVRDIISRNRESKGWLIFATHDISPEPSPYGCTPEFFEEVIKSSLQSGARILPVIGVLDAIRSSGISLDGASRGEACVPMLK